MTPSPPAPRPPPSMGAPGSTLDAFALLGLLGEDAALKDKARALLKWGSDALGASACGLILLQSSADQSFEGFALSSEASDEEAALSSLLEFVDQLITRDELESTQIPCAGSFCAGRALRSGSSDHSAMIFSRSDRSWSPAEIQSIESIARALEQQIDRQSRARAEKLKARWARRFERIQQSNSPALSKANETLALAKELLGARSAFVWLIEGERVSCALKEESSPHSPLLEAHALSDSLAGSARFAPLHFHTLKLHPHFGSLALASDLPGSAALIPFASSQKSHLLCLGSASERELPFAEEEIWVAKQCANWLSEAMETIKTEELLALARLDSVGALEISSDAIVTVDVEGRVLRFNAAAARLAGLAPEASGRPIHESIALVSPAHGAPVELLAQEWASLAPGEPPWGRQAILCGLDGSRLDVECRVAPICSAEGRPLGAALSLRDVTEAQLLERQMIYTRDYDRLTGLLNRDSLFELLGNSLKSARFGPEHCLIYLDIDHLKAINDTHGHSAGDMLLRSAAQFFKTELGERAVVSRFGADEFVILVEYCSLGDGLELATSLRENLSKLVFEWEGQRFPITASMGLTLIDKTRSSPEEVIADADAACFGAKLKGRNQVKVSHQDDLEEIHNRRKEMDWALQLNQALDESRLTLCFQPIVHSHGALDLAVSEALMRLRLPNGSEVSPGAFMDIAERYNIAPKLDRWVVSKLLRDPAASLEAIRQQQPGCARAQININLSGASINDPSFIDFIKEQSAGLGELAESFCFEVTETAAVKSLASAALFLKELKAIGFMIALDDFGAGMSSFGYLKHFPVDIVKIDGSIVKNSDEHFVDRVIMGSIANACSQLGLKVVAECVETEAIFEQVKAAGILWCQGYHLRMPERLPDFNALDSAEPPAQAG